jgi:hypothetical protein
MSRKSVWNERIALSLRVGAIATVLGFVLLAVEQRLGHDVSPEEIVAAQAAPSFAPTPPAAHPGTTQSSDYFPSHFPAPTGEPEVQPPSF